MTPSIRCLLLSFLLLAGGCVSTTKLSRPVPADALVVVVTPATAKQLIFSSAADAKGYFPFGFVKAIGAEATESFLNRELNAQGFNIGQELQRAMVASLAAKGLHAQALVIERPSESFPSPLSPAKLPAMGEARALLDAQITGYGLSAEISGEFRPFIGLRIRMIDARSHAVLYEQRFTYNTWSAKTVRIPFEPAHQWRDMDAVKRDLPGVRAALVTGLIKATDLVAADLALR